MSPIITKHLSLRTVLAYLAVLFLIGGFVAYALFQARLLIEGPQITLLGDETISQEERTVTVEGIAKNIVSISLNGRPIYTDESGYFKETIVLENGYTITTLRAKDRYGRVETVARSYVYIGEKLSDNS